MIRPASGAIAEIRSTALACAIGAAGAFVALAAGIPAPFITGPAVAVTIAGLGGFDARMHGGVRNLCFVVIGVVMGAGVTPDVLASAAAWPASFLLLGVCVAAIMWTTARLLQRFFGHDRRTAVLAASPGHLSFVMSLGAETGADLAAMGIVQSIRLLCLTLLVPFAVSAMGFALEPSDSSPLTTDPLPLAALLAVAWLAGRLANAARLPAGYLIGAMFASTAGHVSGAVEGAVPQWLAVPAYVFMGALIGSRFSGVKLAQLRANAMAGLMTTAVSAALAVAFALAAASLTGLPTGQTLIAFAPGGVETMAAMALLMHADPAYVAAHHVLRLFFLTALVPMFLGTARQDRDAAS